MLNIICAVIAVIYVIILVVAIAALHAILETTSNYRHSYRYGSYTRGTTASHDTVSKSV